MSGDDSIVSALVELLSHVDATRTRVQEKYEKIRTALSGILRLLTNEGAILNHMQGDPERLKGYILKLLNDTEQALLDDIDKMKPRLESVLSRIRN
ncbi:MAG: hypothetical protein ACFE7R_01520 [Candidatus Hodarchaeota archaeon]